MHWAGTLTSSTVTEHSVRPMARATRKLSLAQQGSPSRKERSQKEGSQRAPSLSGEPDDLKRIAVNLFDDSLKGKTVDDSMRRKKTSNRPF